MKVINTGKSTFILTDIRGNTVFLEEGQSARVSKRTAERIKKVPSYYLIKVVEEESDKQEVSNSTKEVLKDIKKGKKKNGLSDNSRRI